MTCPLSAARVFFDGQYSSPRLQHPEGVAIGPDGCDLVRQRRRRHRADRTATARHRGGRLDRRLHARPRLRRRTAQLFACDQRSAAVWRLDARAPARFERFTPPGIRIPNYPGGRRRRGLPLRLRQLRRRHAPARASGATTSTTGEGALWWAEPMRFANGMALAHDGSALFVVRDLRPTRSAASPIGADGRAGRLRRSCRRHRRACPTASRSTTRAICSSRCYEPSRILRARRRRTARDLRRGSDRASLLPSDQHRLRRAAALHRQSRPLAHHARSRPTPRAAAGRARQRTTGAPHDRPLRGHDLGPSARLPAAGGDRRSSSPRSIRTSR